MESWAFEPVLACMAGTIHNTPESAYMDNIYWDQVLEFLDCSWGGFKKAVDFNLFAHGNLLPVRGAVQHAGASTQQLIVSSSVVGVVIASRR